MARVYFEMREYRRVAHTLHEAQSDLGKFMRWYATYLAGEKRMEEDALELVGPMAEAPGSNGELRSLAKELESEYQASSLDGYGMYLYGLVLKQLDAQARALSMLVAAVNARPLLWAAWTEIAGLCTDAVMAAELPLPDHWAKTMFVAHLHLELQQNAESLTLWEELGELFVESDHVVAQAALANYNLREFGVSGDLFEALLERDPYRLEHMDTYSNILYVKEEAAKLSRLAHSASQTEKYRPETCCIIGNYYSLKSQHEKAVTYFRRALKLNSRFLSAWTLMGHEYVEMKNTPAAIEAYRRAVDISPRDYRAWYGLGQTYEILSMPFYALYYYRKATTLRPYDARMWCAMANCFENLDRVPEAIKCYERAQSNSDRDGIALSRLADLYDGLGDSAKAAFYFERNLARLEKEGAAGPAMVKALIYLAVYYKNTGDFAQAELFCSRLHDFGGREKEEAKALLREIRAAHRPLIPSTPNTSNP
ncbi:cell division cycle protein 23, partial [Thecamonas trahens ATCC 50062]